jgi:hypothetical protein
VGGKIKKTRVDCEFVGVINGAPVTVMGRAHIGGGDDPGQRRLDIELHADVVPFGFDPALLVLGGLDAVLLLTARDGALPVPDHRLHVHLDWKLLDENYRDMGGFEVAAWIRADPAGLEIRGQFLEARTHLEPVERLVSGAEGYSGSTVPLGADGLVLTTASTFQTDHGAGYIAIAVSRVVGIGEWEPGNGLDVRSVTVERAGGRERDCRVMVRVEYGSLGSMLGGWDRGQ